MEKPNIPQKAPYVVDVEEGKTYYWCSCGHSKKQPFCDGAHKTTSFTPVAIISKIISPAFAVTAASINQPNRI